MDLRILIYLFGAWAAWRLFRHELPWMIRFVRDAFARSPHDELRLDVAERAFLSSGIGRRRR